MAALPTLSEIAGNHTTVYETYYQQVDPAGINHVGALDAAAFLKRSGLPDGVLSKIWDMADGGGKGFLDKRGFFVALKLVALVQSGKLPTMVQLAVPTPAPCMVDQTRGVMDWSIKPLEHSKYVEMFNSLSPISGKLPGSKVKPVMLNSKLPVDVLGKIWDLSDVDQDGALDEEEFIVAMHLVYKALDNCPIPSVLPDELMPRSKQSGRPVVSALPPDFSTDTLGIRRRPSTPSVAAVDVALHNALNKPAPWVVSAMEKAKYDQLFVTLDTDMDGLVTGPDVKGVFLKTGLPQADLAMIWNLCDTKQSGSLSMEQFALAMHLASERIQGSPLPASLTPDMVPPSLRPQLQGAVSSTLDGTQPLDVLLSSTPPPAASAGSGNKELDMIAEEMKHLQMDKAALEQEIIQGETDLKMRSCELRNLETEIEAVSAMLKQLDFQKAAAQKRLAELSVQVATLKTQLEEQSKLLEEQEQDLEQKRTELRGLCQEESSLQAEIDNKKAQLQALGQTQQETQLQISQVKAKQIALEEQHVQLRTWVSQVDRALQAGDPGLVPESLLREGSLSAGLPDLEYQQLSNTEGSSPTSFVSAPDEESKEDPFKSKDPFSDMNGFLGDPFAGEDPFKAADPFKGTEDPFAGDPFKSAFDSEAKDGDYFEAGFQDTQPAGAAIDPFDPFGLGKPASQEPIVAVGDADPFGSDPFAPPSAARAESPTPALPPKKGKNPPPRPAPPKHLAGGRPVPAGPTRAAPAPPLPEDDPFASTSGNTATESFANFADFGDC